MLEEVKYARNTNSSLMIFPWASLNPLKFYFKSTPLFMNHVLDDSSLAETTSLSPSYADIHLYQKRDFKAGTPIFKDVSGRKVSLVFIKTFSW